MMNAKNNRPYGWSGTILQFLTLYRSDWLGALLGHHQVCMNCPADERQKSAWEYSFDTLKKELKQLIQLKPELENYTIIFEYELPRKRVNHHDVIILGSSIFILEFRDNDKIIRADVDQAGASASDLKDHHAASYPYDVIPILVLARAKDFIRRDGDVIILSPDHIADYFNVQAELEEGSPIDANAWIRSE
jgi:hypothetical protein